jgi:hypothetical protein
MQTTVNIPAVQSTQIIKQFRFIPGELTCVVLFEEGGEQKSIMTDFSNLVAAATATQKTTLKEFFKRIGASALDDYNADVGVDVAEGDMTGEIFD